MGLTRVEFGKQQNCDYIRSVTVNTYAVILMTSQYNFYIDGCSINYKLIGDFRGYRGS